MTRLSADQPRIHYVMTHATQFDGPCMAFVNRTGNVEIEAFFTKSKNGAVTVDREISTTPQWQNVTCGYQWHETNDQHLIAQLKIIRFALRDSDLTVFAGYNRLAYVLGAIWGRLTGRKVALRSDSVLLYGQPGGLKGLLKRLGLPLFLKFYHVYFCTGKLSREYLIHYGASPEKVFAWPYNINNELFYDVAQRRSAEVEKLKKNLALPNRFTVLGIMKFVPREDPMTLVRAFIKMRQAGTDAQLVLVGCGRLETEMKAEIPLEFKNDVYFTGYIPYCDLPLYFAFADIFVHTAVKEQWGCSVNEAMAAGCAVVTADTVGSSYDLIAAGKNGYVFPAGDSSRLADILITLASGQNDTKQMGDIGREIIQNWEYKDIEQSMRKAIDFLYE
jgi:Glycosyltransferase